jgi:hypothetical protein
MKWTLASKPPTDADYKPTGNVLVRRSATDAFPEGRYQVMSTPLPISATHWRRISPPKEYLQ